MKLLIGIYFGLIYNPMGMMCHCEKQLQKQRIFDRNVNQYYYLFMSVFKAI